MPKNKTCLSDRGESNQEDPRIFLAMNLLGNTKLLLGDCGENTSLAKRECLFFYLLEGILMCPRCWACENRHVNHITLLVW